MTQAQEVRVPRQSFASIADVQSKASFTILTPSVLPNGAELEVAQYGAWPGKEGVKTYDWVWLFYKTPEGRRITIAQGALGGPYVDKATPADAHGQVLVQGKPGVWVDGTPQGDPIGGITGWNRGVLKVGWHPTENPDSTLPQTYVVMAFTADYSIADVIQIAQSVK